MGHAISAAIVFDTLAYAKKLEAHGVTVEQAEAHAEALADVFETFSAKISTKPETQDAVGKLSNEIAILRKDMEVGFAKVDAKISDLKTEMIKWGLGIALAQAALIISVLKFVH
ncbi:hypothetical protein BH10PSE19_BH10PSE19_03860 [soil metagenome]